MQYGKNKLIYSDLFSESCLSVSFELISKLFDPCDSTKDLLSDDLLSLLSELLFVVSDCENFAGGDVKLIRALGILPLKSAGFSGRSEPKTMC